MQYLVVLCMFMSLACSGSVESNFTIKNPEKFAQGKLIPEYLNKVEKYLHTLNKDKALTIDVIKKQRRSFNKDKTIYSKVTETVKILTHIKELLDSFSYRLRFLTSGDYYTTIKNNDFIDLKKIKDKKLDPSDILKVDVSTLDKNRDCLYVFLSKNFSGQKTSEQIRAMTSKDIMKEIGELEKLALKKGLDENSSYIKLLREIGLFFNDELVKQEYDAFIDGPQALNLLIIPGRREREALFYQLQSRVLPVLNDLLNKFIETQSFLKSYVEKK